MMFLDPQLPRGLHLNASCPVFSVSSFHMRASPSGSSLVLAGTSFHYPVYPGVKCGEAFLPLHRFCLGRSALFANWSLPLSLLGCRSAGYTGISQPEGIALYHMVNVSVGSNLATV